MRGLSMVIPVALVLVAQVWAVLVPQAVVCVPVGPCGDHAVTTAVHADVAAHDDDCCDHSDSPAAVPAEHEHGLVDLVGHTHSQCRCHVHIPVDRREGAIGKGDVARVDDRDRTPVIDMASVWAVLAGTAGAGTDHAPVRSCAGLDGGFAVGARACALRTTRLII